MASTSGAVSAGAATTARGTSSPSRGATVVLDRRVATRPAASPAWRQGVAPSGFRVLVVARAVAVVVESRDLFRAEARGVPPDGVGAVLVTVLGVPYQVSFCHVEALLFALAGLYQRSDRGVDVVVGVLGPSRHVLRLLGPFALVDRESESAQSNGVCCLRVRVWDTSTRTQR